MPNFPSLLLNLRPFIFPIFPSYPLNLKSAFHIFDFSTKSNLLNIIKTLSLPETKQLITEIMKESGALIGVGKYNEDRPVYTSPSFTNRSVHMGLDFFLPASTPIHLPLKGIIHSFNNNDKELDFGPTIIIQHEIDIENKKITFHSLFGHLSKKSLLHLKKGEKVDKGWKVGEIGEEHENGGWVPHLHYQIVRDLQGKEGDFNGVGAKEREWKENCPDPNLLLGLNLKY